MSILAPDPLSMTLGYLTLRAWMGGSGSNCWAMWYDAPNLRWLLDGGKGLCRYQYTGTWDCNGPNTFSDLLWDYTLQAPSSITVWPFSQSPCACPLNPQPVRLRPQFRLFPPYVHYAGIRPDPLTLHLTPYMPAQPPRIKPYPLTLHLVPAAPRASKALGPAPLTLHLDPSYPATHSAVRPLATDLLLTLSDPGIRPNFAPAALALTLNPAYPAVQGALRPYEGLLFLLPSEPSLHHGPGPAPLTLTLTPAAPALRDRVNVVPLTLTLTPAAPTRRPFPSPYPLTLFLTPAYPGTNPALRPPAPTLYLSLHYPSFWPALRPPAPTLTLTLAEPGVQCNLETVAPTLFLTPAYPATHSALRPAAPTLTLGPANPRVHGILEPDAPALVLGLAEPTVSTTPADCTDLGMAVGPCMGPKSKYLVTLTGVVDGGTCPDCGLLNATFPVRWTGGAWNGTDEGYSGCLGMGAFWQLQWDSFNSRWIVSLLTGDSWYSTDWDCSTGSGTWIRLGISGICGILNTPTVEPCIS